MTRQDCDNIPTDWSITKITRISKHLFYIDINGITEKCIFIFGKARIMHNNVKYIISNTDFLGA